MDKLRILKVTIERCLDRMRFFEIEKKVEEPLSVPIEERKKGLDDLIFNADQYSQHQLQGGSQRSEKSKEQER